MDAQASQGGTPHNQTNTPLAAGPTSGQDGSAPKCSAPPIQITVGTTQDQPRSTNGARVLTQLLTPSFIWTLILIVVLIAWRKEILRLLHAVIKRIESGDKVGFGSVLTLERPEGEFPHYRVIEGEDEEWSIDGLDKEE